MFTPYHRYTHTPDWIQYLECAIELIPDLLLLTCASRVTLWFNQRATARLSVKAVRFVALFGILIIALAAWTVHFHSLERINCGGK